MKKCILLGIIFVFALSLMINVSDAIAGKPKTERLKITGVESKKCLDIIKAEVKKVEGVKKITFSKTNFKDKSTIISIVYQGENCDPLKKAITDKGYTAECADCLEGKCDDKKDQCAACASKKTSK